LYSSHAPRYQFHAENRGRGCVTLEFDKTADHAFNAPERADCAAGSGRGCDVKDVPRGTAFVMGGQRTFDRDAETVDRSGLSAMPGWTVVAGQH
jgi:hypothetical protein